ncbi:MAG: N-acetylmuramic acid 6-phosphate etherase [Vicinamibacterales bacterium]|nr:N-acetylmuramic acid 6-phosphate etherase [Vicinamibacterales bacterium]
MSPRSKWQRLPTEAINPATRAIDTLALTDVIDVMVRDNHEVLGAVRREKAKIAKGAGIIARALRKDGRLVMVGAGTSGRLAVLEAAEMPPTFGTSGTLVQAILAGGRSAVYRAKEGAEDDAAAGARAIARLEPTANDVVVGISASGVTPFVRGAMARAKSAGARVVGVTCNRRSPLRPLADIMIVLQVGPEVVAGSSRLKAGTATKIVLNMLTTAAMISIGKTYGNLMVDVRATNGKLRDRARRIVSAVTGLNAAAAGALLDRAGWNAKAAIVMQATGLSRVQALTRLRASGGSVRKALSGRR